MSTVKVLLEATINNSSGWLGLDDYKKYQNATNDLEALKLMAELEGCTPLNLLCNLCDNNTPSKFVAVESGELSQASKIDTWVPITEQLPPHDENNKHTSVFVDVFGDGDRWPECYYCFLAEEWIWNDTGDPISINVTHWKAITLPNVSEV